MQNALGSERMLVIMYACCASTTRSSCTLTRWSSVFGYSTSPAARLTWRIETGSSLRLPSCSDNRVGTPRITPLEASTL
jgi:hypothetical protein